MARAQRVRVVRTVETKITHTLQVSSELLIAALREKGYEIPDNAVVHFKAPFRADYGEDLDITDERCLEVIWSGHDRKVEEETK